jgi:hypothetical protein
MAGYDNEQPTPQQMAALELFHQLVNLSPDDGDKALMVTLRMPNGQFVGDVWLSQADVEAATDKLIVVNVQRADAEAGLEPAEPLAEDDLTEESVAEGIKAFERFLSDGGPV